MEKKQHNCSLWQFDLLYSDKYSRIQCWWWWMRWLVKLCEAACCISVCSDELSLSMYCFTFYVNCVHRWALMTCMENNAHCSILRLKRDTCTAQVMSCLVSTGSRLRLRQQFQSRWLASSQFVRVRMHRCVWKQSCSSQATTRSACSSWICQNMITPEFFQSTIVSFVFFFFFFWYAMLYYSWMYLLL